MFEVFCNIKEKYRKSSLVLSHFHARFPNHSSHDAISFSIPSSTDDCDGRHLNCQQFSSNHPRSSVDPNNELPYAIVDLCEPHQNNSLCDNWSFSMSIDDGDVELLSFVNVSWQRHKNKSCTMIEFKISRAQIHFGHDMKKYIKFGMQILCHIDTVKTSKIYKIFIVSHKARKNCMSTAEEMKFFLSTKTVNVTCIRWICKSANVRNEFYRAISSSVRLQTLIAGGNCKIGWV